MRQIDADELLEEIKSLKMMIGGMRSGREITTKYLEEYQKSILKIIDEQPTVNDWIPCSERLPKTYNDVYITVEARIRMGIHKGELTRATTKGFLSSHNHWKIINDIIDSHYLDFSDCENKVIAWKPFPEPYKGD